MRLFVRAIMLNFFLSISLHAFTLISRSFSKREAIPPRYTCDGKNIPPYLTWNNAPLTTQSFALICQDMTTFRIHWLVANLPATITNLRYYNTYTNGTNDFQTIGYAGPCIEDNERHEYKFELYALDSTLPLDTGFLYSELVQAMQGHILAVAQLFSYYQKR